MCTTVVLLALVHLSACQLVVARGPQMLPAAWMAVAGGAKPGSQPLCFARRQHDLNCNFISTLELSRGALGMLQSCRVRFYVRQVLCSRAGLRLILESSL